MLIEEINPRILYHGSKILISVGTILSPRRSKKLPEEIAVESILEHFRPKHMLPRSKCVYMVDEPNEDLLDRVGGYHTYIYQTLPIGEVEKNDVAWWGYILTNGALDYQLGDTEVLRELQEPALNYWNSISSQRPTWEYRSPTAKVIKRIK
jgi:hypothetical protein